MMLFFACCLLFLGGCTPMIKNAPTFKTVKVSTPFDAEKAKALSQKNGTNTVKGSAVVPQQGGGISTCAGKRVYLTPVTDYATTLMLTLYGNTERGTAKGKKSRLLFSMKSNLLSLTY